MADISSVFLVGRLSRDSQMTYGANGVAIVRFGVAVNKPRRNQDGNWEDETSFFDCVYLGRGAESVNQYLEKGRQVAVQGELRQSRWMDKVTGKEQRRVEVVVTALSLGQQSKNSQQPGQGASRQMRDESSPEYQNNGYQNQSYRNNAQSNFRTSESQITGGPEVFEDDTIPF